MLSLSDFRWTSVGTADAGMVPGSVRVVFAWQARARAQNMLYIIAREAGTPPVSAKNVTVKAE
jgi:hypothetical protein